MSLAAIKKKFRIYMPFAKSSVQGMMAYRVSFFIWVLTDWIYMVAAYFLWRAIYDSSGGTVMSGFTFPEIVTYVLLINAAGLITGSNAMNTICWEVANGSIAMSLIKPINYSARLFFSSMGENLFSLFMTAAPLMILSGIIYPYLVSPPRVLLFFVSAVLGFLISFFFDICFAMVSFYTTYVWGLIFLKNSAMRMLSGSIIPFAFFPGVLRKVFEWLPFAGIQYTPVMIWLGKYDGETILFYIGLQVFWVLLLWGLSKLLWRWAIKRLTILGG